MTWPLAGLITDRPAASLVAGLLAVALGGLAVAAGARPDRAAATWLAGSIAWSVLALAVFAPSLATVTPGLPNDHYHAFLDPLVLALVGVGLARLSGVAGLPGPARPAGIAGPRAPVARVGAAIAFAVLVAIAVIAWPPAVSPDGGWRLADAAAARVIATIDARPVALDGIPPFKSADALRFPLEHRGVGPLAADALGAGTPPAGAVLVCDPLFAGAVGAPCGGPAESAWQAAHAAGLAIIDRFDSGPRRVITVYAASATPPPSATSPTYPENVRTPVPADRRSLSPRPERGGTFRSCPGVFYCRPGVLVGGLTAGRWTP